MGRFNKYSGGVEAERRAEKKDLLGVAMVFSRLGCSSELRQSLRSSPFGDRPEGALRTLKFDLKFRCTRLRIEEVMQRALWVELPSRRGIASGSITRGFSTIWRTLTPSAESNCGRRGQATRPKDRCRQAVHLCTTDVADSTIHVCWRAAYIPEQRSSGGRAT